MSEETEFETIKRTSRAKTTRESTTKRKPWSPP